MQNVQLDVNLIIDGLTKQIAAQARDIAVKDAHISALEAEITRLQKEEVKA